MSKTTIQSNELLHEKTCLQGFRPQVRHKPGCTTTEDCYSLATSDLGSKGIVLSGRYRTS